MIFVIFNVLISKLFRYSWNNDFRILESNHHGFHVLAAAVSVETYLLETVVSTQKIINNGLVPQFLSYTFHQIHILFNVRHLAEIQKNKLRENSWVR